MDILLILSFIIAIFIFATSIIFRIILYVISLTVQIILWILPRNKDSEDV